MTALRHPKPATLDRIELRTTPDTKRLIARASSLAGVTLSKFMLSSAQERAKQLLAEHETITLSANDWDQFVSILDNPTPPNDRLKAAMQKHLAKAR